MRTIFWFCYFWISLIALTPAMLYTKRLHRLNRLTERDALVHQKVHHWMHALLRLAGVSVLVTGLEHIPKEPVLFVSNHQGNFDIPILLCNLDRPHGIVAKAELQKLPFIRIWMRYLGCVFIDRHNPRHSAAALHEATENLKNGRCMIIFPEGTRSRGDQVGEFKAGGFKIAQKAKVPIVPIYIDGSYKVMESNGMRIKPATVRVKILPPIDTTSFSKEDFHEIGAMVRDLILQEKVAV